MTAQPTTIALVIFENQPYNNVIGNASAPYLTHLSTTATNLNATSMHEGLDAGVVNGKNTWTGSAQQ